MNTRIFLDQDGVLANWQQHVFDTFDVASPTHIQRAEYDTWKCCGFTTENDFWRKLDEYGDEWWANIPPFEYTQDLWQLCNRIAPTCILTKTGPNPSAASGKMKWIDKHLNTHNFLMGRVKRFCAGPQALLIDDKEKNCMDFVKHGGNAFLWPASYNKYRGLSHNDALEILKNLMSQWGTNE
jgi:5'(3')-deoxyribonucleotidase